MKREERTALNQLRKSVTPETICVEIPVNYTHEGRQAIHELLTIEKGLYAPCIYWNDIRGEYCVHYERTHGDPTATATKRDQETCDIDEVTAELPRRDYTWTGYPKPTETTAEPATETETTETTETAKNEKEEKTMFPNLTKAINAHYDTAAEKFASDLLTVTAGYALDHAYYRDLMTPKAFDECKALDPADTLPETVRAKMTARFTRQNERNRAERLAKLTRAENAEPLENASISVEWKRSAMWGSNPTAVVIANYDANHATEGRASGCGYDKESAAIATAVNASPSIMRVLYEHAENGGSFPYSVCTYAGLPYFDGGCGVSCFRNVFAACGWRWEDGAHRKTFDVYTLTRA